MYNKPQICENIHHKMEIADAHGKVMKPVIVEEQHRVCFVTKPQNNKHVLDERRCYDKNKNFWEELNTYIPGYDTDRNENDVSNNFSIVACVFVTAGTFLPSRCLATIGGFLPNRAVT
jgi:hypothetical protein